MHICGENDWGTEYICFSKRSWIILQRLVLVLRERSHEEKGEIESVCGRWREKWQLIGIWVSSDKSSVFQQHLLLLPLKLLWDWKAPGLLCSPGTASDPCLAYTANRNTYLHQPSQLKRSPAHLCLARAPYVMKMRQLQEWCGSHRRAESCCWCRIPSVYRSGVRSGPCPVKSSSRPLHSTPLDGFECKNTFLSEWPLIFFFQCFSKISWELGMHNILVQNIH